MSLVGRPQPMVHMDRAVSRLSKLTGGLLALLAVLLAFSGAAWAERASANDTARFLAGLQPSPQSSLAALTSAQDWQWHAQALDQAWGRADQGQLAKVRAWSSRYLPSSRPLMLYMFSGPDFLYANAFFPNATTYVLSGLEPVGGLPDVARLSPSQRATALQGLRTPLEQILQFSYFITKDMSKQLRASKLTGTLPLLYVFLARTGKRIDQVSLVSLKSNGSVTRRAKGGANGVKIVFSDSGGQRTLYYFKTDLSNGGLKKSGFRTFCRSLGSADALLKSASYLPHLDGFSLARDFLLKQSVAIVQDDTGIPLRYFAPSTWSLRPFGAYYGPIPIFAEKFQPEMEQLFAQGRTTPVNFGIGYRYPPKDTNILLAVKHSAVVPERPPRRERRRWRRR